MFKIALRGSAKGGQASPLLRNSLKGRSMMMVMRMMVMTMTMTTIMVMVTPTMTKS